MQGFVRAEGNRFTVDGQTLALRGVGVGSWLNLEHFMIGVPGWDGDIRHSFAARDPGFMQRFAEHFFAEADARYLRSLGVNLIRVPLNHRLFWDDQLDAPREEGFAQLRRLAALCERAGLYFLPDLHTTPGGQNPDWHSESRTGTAEFWQFGDHRRRAVALWRMIAAELRDCRMLLGYDLLNEPVLPEGGTAMLDAFYRDAIRAIREVDTRHIAFLEGDRFSMDFHAIAPPDDANWAFSYHFYPTVWDESLLDASLAPGERRARFSAALEALLATMGAYTGPLLCGEAGYELCRLDEAFGEEITRQTLELLERRGSSWCLWAYKDADFMSLLRPRADSGWMRLSRAVAAQWNHHDAERLGYAASDAVDALCPYSMTPEEKYRLQFTIRAQVARLDARHVLAPQLDALSPEALSALPADFAYDRCTHRAALERVLRAVCGR